MGLTGKTFHSGRKVVTAAGTRGHLVTISTAAIFSCIAAETDNTGIGVIGGEEVDETLASRKGLPLNPGESSPWLPIDDLYDIYVDVYTSGDGFTFVYVSPE